MKTVPIYNGTAIEAGHGAILENRFGHACQTLGTLVGALMQYRNVGGAAPGVVHDPRLDGGSEPAFDAAIQAVLNRIEKMANTDEFWKFPKLVPAFDTLEAKIRLRGIQTAVDSAEDKVRPSHKYNVEITPVDTGGFCVFLRMKGGSVLGGFGDSVDEAMRAFDREFVKRRPDFTPLPETPSPGIHGEMPAGTVDDDDAEPPAPPKPGPSDPEPPSENKIA